MSLEQQIFQALAAIPGFEGRVYAITFPQSTTVPATPACRFAFISSAVSPDICGDGGDELADTSTQVDVIAKTFTEARAMRLLALAAMRGLAIPTLFDGGFDDFDDETKLYRCILQFVSYPSSP